MKSQNEKVVGFHILSPHAGEITQGVALAIKMGVTKAHLDSCVGIHPTIAEVPFYFFFLKKIFLILKKRPSGFINAIL